MYVVDLLKFKSKNLPWKFLSRWKRALHYLENISYCVSHVFCEGNQVADKLVSHAIYIENTAWWFVYPNIISLEVSRDMMGLPFSDFVNNQPLFVSW